MSKLQTISDFQREIGQVDRLIELEEALARAHGMNFSSELTIESLRARKAELLEQMEVLGDEAMLQQEMNVVVEGRPVHNHSVDATFLSRLLLDLQRVVQSIIASAAGSHGRAGPMTRTVQRQSSLRFAGSFPGSFGMRLETPVAGLELDDPGSIAHALDSMVRLLASGDETGALLEAIAPLNARARAAYMAMLEHLHANGADVHVEWNSIRGPQKARLTSGRADRALSTLRKVDEVESLQAHAGVLDGAIKTRGIFEFRTRQGRVLTGSVSQAAIPKLRDFFDQECVAVVTTREITDRTTGDKRVHHRLEDLRPITSDLVPEF